MNNSGTGLVGNHFGNGGNAGGGVRHFVGAVGRFLARTRCKPLLVIAAACLIVQEQYPLSTFPMYSSFGPSTYYLYLADGTGKPVACFPTLGMSTATLKKVFSNEMRKEGQRMRPRVKRLSAEQKQIVGERLLLRLRDAPAARLRGAPAPNGLRLYEVDIALRKSRFNKETILVAEAK